MKNAEIQKLSRENLLAEQSKLQAETLQLRVQQASGQLANPARLRSVRRTVARIQTKLSALNTAAQ